MKKYSPKKVKIPSVDFEDFNKVEFVFKEENKDKDKVKVIEQKRKNKKSRELF